VEIDEGYFSHIPLLAATVIKTSGPVLELGAGLGSTLMLHGLCGALRRRLVTIDSNCEWLDKFINLKRSWHDLKLVDNFLNLPEYTQHWGLAFIDHGICKQRGISLQLLSDTDIIVCHDTCHYFLYDYQPVINTFKYRWNFKPASTPMTTLVSQTIDVGLVFGELGL